jgi:hypothetical protein
MVDAGKQQVLDRLRFEVRRAREELGDDEWRATLELLEDELRDGQPFFLRWDCASSSKSISETPVAAE